MFVVMAAAAAFVTVPLRHVGRVPGWCAGTGRCGCEAASRTYPAHESCSKDGCVAVLPFAHVATLLQNGLSAYVAVAALHQHKLHDKALHVSAAARCCCCCPQVLYNAQMIRTWSLLLRTSHRRGYIVAGRFDASALVESPYLMHPIEHKTGGGAESAAAAAAAAAGQVLCHVPDDAFVVGS